MGGGGEGPGWRPSRECEQEVQTVKERSLCLHNGRHQVQDEAARLRNILNMTL